MANRDLPSEEPLSSAIDDALAAPVPSVGQAAIHGARLAAIGYAASQALTFAAYLVLVRLISPSAFGLYAAGTVLTGVGGLFAQSGMLAALINRKDRIDEAASTAFVALLITGVTITLVAIALSPLMGLAFHRAHVTAVSVVMSGWLFVRAMTIVPDALLQRRFSFARRVVVDPLGALAFAGVAIPIAIAGAGVWALVAGTYASMLVQATFAWGFARFRPRLREASFALWRELASFARSVIVAEGLLRVSQQIDALALGRFHGTATLGQYRNGLRLAIQPAGAFVSILSYVLLPAFARIAHVPERIAGAARRTLWVSMTVVVPVSFASLPLGVPLAVVLLGPQWRPAGHVVAGLCGMVLGTAVVSVTAELLKAVGRPAVLVGVEIVGFCLIAVTVTVAAVVWGAVAVAIAMSLSSCGTAAYALARLCSVLGLELSGILLGFLGPLIAAAAMLAAMLGCAALTHPLAHAEGLRIGLLLLEVLVGAIVYSAALAVVDPPRRREAIRLTRARLGRRGPDAT